MVHETEIVYEESSNDENIVVTIRCCGDPKTDSPVTIPVVNLVDGSHSPRLPEEIIADIEAHHDRVKLKHEAIQSAKVHLKNIKNRKKVHA